MHQLFILYEHATGYALFRTSEFEEIGTFLPQVKESILDISKFRSVVFLVAFQKFDTWREGFENLKSISKGQLPKSLQLFLENNVPKSKKSKQGVMLGVQDPALASTISEIMHLNCSTSGAVFNIARGIRLHFRKLLKTFVDQPTISNHERAMSHHYGRSKVNLTMNKFDGAIIQSLNTVDELGKNINTLIARVAKLYSVHFPELKKIVTDPRQYIRCMKEIKNRKEMPENIDSLLLDIVKEESIVKDILTSVEYSMGEDIAEEDLENISMLIEHVFSLMKQEESQTDYVKTKMHVIAPSLGTLMGEMAGARLITEARSLTRLSEFPASTIQVLGAKKSLFRAMKSKEAPLKFCSISKAAFIGQDGRITKGRMSRFLANKCSLAARSDCYSGNPTGVHGEKLKLEVQDRVKFYVRGKGINAVVKKKKARRKKNKKSNKKSELEMEVDR